MDSSSAHSMEEIKRHQSLSATFGSILGIDKADHAHAWAALLDPITVRKGDRVCSREEETSSLYLVQRGTFVVSLNAGERTHVLVELTAGSFFGEMGLLSPANANADVVAQEEGQLLELTQEAYATMVAEHPATARGLMHGANEVLARRVMGIESIDEAPKPAQQSLLARLAGLFFGHNDKGKS